MARKRRDWHPGACYHVTCRGNHKSNIFQEAEDYERYLNILYQAGEQFDHSLYSYCLMTNHVHLLLHTADIDLGCIMKKVSMCFTQYINRKYNWVGHLFQDRYGAEQLNDESAMLVVSRYIHLNPVKAGMVSRPEDYVWSSYRAFVGLAENRLTEPQSILRHIGGIEQYEAYILAAKDMES